MVIRFICLITCVLIFVSVATAQEIVESTQCVEEPYGFSTVCGYVTLPEDYENPTDGAVQIYYAQIKSQSDNPQPDPLVYLTGGPGSSGTQLLESSFRTYLRSFAGDRDIIVIDQRGTGLSVPNLYCREAMTRLADVLQTTRDTHAETVLDVLTDCHTRLSESDIQLDTFHSQNNARDITNVLLSLGYEEWNLVGVSYGSRLALTMMRDYPNFVRSVILDSVYPLEADLYIDAYFSAERALDVLFTTCEADIICNTAYPDLETVFYDLYHELNRNPVVTEFTPPRYQTLQVEINGYRLYDWVFSWLYTVNSIQSIPRLIYELHEGRTDNIVRTGTLYEAGFTSISLGMHYTVQCQEEYISDDNRNYRDILDEFPHLDGYIRYPVEGLATVERLCDLWQAQPRDRVANLPVTSDIPALLLSGNFDPITPPTYADLVDATLDKSYNIVLPHVGHGVLRSDRCAVEIALEFIDAPHREPNSDCVADTQPLMFD